MIASGTDLTRLHEHRHEAGRIAAMKEYAVDCRQLQEIHSQRTTLRAEVTSNRPYAVHHRLHVTGVFYDPPHRHGAGGIYILHCGSTSAFNHNTTADPNFILKVGHSKDILRRLHEHQQTSSPLCIHGEVVFLFGMEIDKCNRVPAESLLKFMLTEFGFSRVIVYNSERRSMETFSFNEKTLPLIHDVVCGIRYVYDPPIDRIIPDHESRGEEVHGRRIRHDLEHVPH